MGLTFAIDFDDTLTAAPELWKQFCDSAKAMGHRTIIVTARRGTDENRADVIEFQKRYGFDMPAYFTGMASKLWFVQERGIRVDIWCDDSPASLVNGH